METPGEKNGTAEPARSRKKARVRPWVRAMHRDAGYFVVGFTLIYAISGLAVNHIGDWDPNFRQIDRTHQVSLPQGNDAQITAAVLAALGVKERPEEVTRIDASLLEIRLAERTLQVEQERGVVREEGQSPRFFLRVANYLHLNRGKRAWRYIADVYAVLLIGLAVSGLFMIPGRKGFLGRGAIIASVGALIPALYVLLSGAP